MLENEMKELDQLIVQSQFTIRKARAKRKECARQLRGFQKVQDAGERKLGDPSLQCPKCPFIAATPMGLKIHMGSKHK